MISSFGLLWDNVLLNILLHVSGAYAHIFLLGIYPEQTLLGHRVCISLHLLGNVKLLSKVVVL